MQEKQFGGLKYQGYFISFISFYFVASVRVGQCVLEGAV